MATAWAAKFLGLTPALGVAPSADRAAFAARGAQLEAGQPRGQAAPDRRRPPLHASTRCPRCTGPRGVGLVRGRPAQDQRGRLRRVRPAGTQASYRAYHRTDFGGIKKATETLGQASLPC
jgi:hypothetical protein